MPPYTYTGPLNCTTPLNTSSLHGKTAIVTGSASGLGEAYVRALASAGCNVCIADLNAQKGSALATELSSAHPDIKAKFVQCNVTSWDDQVRVFHEAAALSSSGKIHYVVANAGMIKPDTVFGNPDSAAKPEATKPDLQTLNVNITGAMYTITLAQHTFIRQNGTTPSPTQDDTCLILIGSGASYLDGPRNPLYAASKWAMRATLHSLRRTAHYHGSRVNMISPYYVKTSIMSEETFQHVKSCGVEFATLEDAQHALLRLLSDESVNGKNLFIGGRRWAPESGYWDLDLDDFHTDLLNEIQIDQMKSSPVEDGLFSENADG
ncbi:hypothetical protein H2198_003155 [Neophaeococcomyces mojaviensis]|uniref:Uncharacterized protein n=1 Tax=Neophaeococcomyces mojaviensis TaxID=3383035 RepID=A0ACC3AC93_9EURO|nr:hypothetical protein H2198_003155 [Knufia sp. JES_112]